MLERLGPQNLVRLIMECAAVMPDQVAITTADESVTYAQLVDLTVQFARHLRRQNVRAGMRIAIMPDHPIIAVGLSLACSLIGCAWIAGTAHVLAHPGLGISHLLCMNIPPAGSRVPCVFVDPSWTRPPQDGRVDAPFTGYANAQQTWMIARSSGTTGEAKFIGLSEAAFYRRATENNFISEAERPVYLALFPLLAYTGTLAMMRTLAIGGTFIYADPGETYGRTRIDVMHGSPAQLQQFMDTSPPNGRRIPLARMGGGVAGAGLFRRLLLYFDRIMHVYGSTEAATTATRIIGAADIGDMTPSVGRAVAGVQVEIVEPDGVRLPAGQEGIVRIRTPSQVSSYIGDPELSAAAFRAGWFHPGDLGVLSADGELRITGRVNDQLNVGGVKLNPVVIDTVVQETPGIRDGACFAWMDEDGMYRVALAISLAAPVDVARPARVLRDAVITRVGARGAPRALFVLEHFPRNANGKIARTELAKALAGVRPMMINDQ